MTWTLRSGTSSGPLTPPLDLRSGTGQALRDVVAGIAQQDDATPLSAANERWGQDASILLLGIRGTGKTSLAVLAAGRLGFRLVDADQHFYAATGLSRAAYVSKYGFEEYRSHELSLLRSCLQENLTRCIIVCGPGSVEASGQGLLKDIEKRHPVIYIMRDPHEVDQYLRTNDTSRISRLVEQTNPGYRSLSNFEFYNLSEPVDAQVQTSLVGTQLQSHPSLVLKHLEHDFIRLVQSIRSQGYRPSISQARHSLSFLAPELKPFTYALAIPLDRVSDIAGQLRSTDLVADAIELVIDLEDLLAGRKTFDHSIATHITKQYYTLRRSVRLPVIFHVQLIDPSRHVSVPTPDRPAIWAEYLAALYHGLRLAPEYLTLDLSCDPEAAQYLVARKVSTKILAHSFDHSLDAGGWDSPFRLELVKRAGRWGCDIVRICQAATSLADNAGVERFLFLARKSIPNCLPLIAYNTGRAGRSSCYTNSILSPVTHELVSNAPGPGCDWMITVQAAQNALYASFTLDSLMFGIYGSAVSAAMSPVMHNAAFEFCRMPHRYRVFQSSSLQQLEGIVYDPNFGGASISSPFKKEIIPLLDYLSPEAQAIGAVNTLIPLRSRSLGSLVDRNRAGPVAALFGDNTDWIGIYNCIRQNLSPINSVSSRTTALILGAGGMAQATVYAAIRLGVRNIYVCNRTLSNTEKLVKQFNGRSFSIHNIDLVRASPGTSPQRSGTATPVTQRTESASVRAIASMEESWPAGADPPTIVVSCIARVSENGQPPADNHVPDAWLTSATGGVAIELAYNPVETPLYQQVCSLSSKGWIAIHGLQVLPEQGFAQFELFTGRKAPQHLMRAQMTQHATAISRQSSFGDG